MPDEDLELGNALFNIKVPHTETSMSDGTKYYGMWSVAVE
jgi:hypothetical protein